MDLASSQHRLAISSSGLGGGGRVRSSNGRSLARRSPASGSSSSMWSTRRRAEASQTRSFCRSQDPSHDSCHLPGPSPYRPPPRADLFPPTSVYNSPTRYGLPRSKWTHKLCHEPKEDTSTCCLGFWVPCALYGKTEYKLQQISADRDPLDERNYRPCNRSCWLYAGLEILRFGWVLVLIQHSRVRATYNIEGTIGSDFIQALCCESCTLMQDHREVCEREKAFLETTQETKAGEIIDRQPRKESGMRYDITNSAQNSGIGPSTHRKSLVREKTIDVTITQSPEIEVRANVSDAKQGEEQAHAYQGPKKLQKHSKIMFGGDDYIKKGKEESDRKNLEAAGGLKKDSRNLSPIGSALNPINESFKLENEDRNAVITSRQPWRGQNVVAKQDVAFASIVRRSFSDTSHTLTACPGDGNIGNNSQGQGTTMPSVPLESFIGNTPAYDGKSQGSMQYPGAERCRRNSSPITELGTIHRQQALRKARPIYTTISSTSKSDHFKDYTADETVLVYYSDGELPQRHCVRDCTRARASTIGPSETLLERCNERSRVIGQHHLAECAEITPSTEESSVLDQHDMVECKEVVIGENFKDTNSAHNLDDCPGKSQENDTEPQLNQATQHIIGDCLLDNGTVDTVSQHVDPNPQLVSQHFLSSCAIEKTQAPDDPEPTPSASEHPLAECARIAPTENPLKSITVAQHGIADCTVVKEVITTDVSYNATAVTSDSLQQGENRPAFIDPAERSERYNATVTISGAQPPIIIITTTDVIDDMSANKSAANIKKDSDILVGRAFVAPLTERGLGDYAVIEDVTEPSPSESHNDGATDQKGKRQLSQAAAALRKVLGDAVSQDTVPADGVGAMAVSTVQQKNRGRARGGQGKGKRTEQNSGF